MSSSFVFRAGVLVLTFAGFSSVVQAQQAPGVRVLQVRSEGSGCPAGSSSAIVSPDGSALTVIFDDFTAVLTAGLPEVGNLPPRRGGGGGGRPGSGMGNPGAVDDPASANAKGCRVSIFLDYPNDWSVSVKQVDIRGYASLDFGVRGVQRSAYFFNGIQNERREANRTVIVGPFAGDYQRSDTFDAGLWSPCGQAQKVLNINTLAAVRRENPNNLNSSGMLTVDSIDGRVSQVYGLAWKRCGGVPPPPPPPQPTAQPTPRPTAQPTPPPPPPPPAETCNSLPGGVRYVQACLNGGNCSLSCDDGEATNGLTINFGRLRWEATGNLEMRCTSSRDSMWRVSSANSRWVQVFNQKAPSVRCGDNEVIQAVAVNFGGARYDGGNLEARCAPLPQHLKLGTIRFVQVFNTENAGAYCNSDEAMTFAAINFGSARSGIGNLEIICSKILDRNSCR